MYLLNSFARAGCDTRSIFKRSLTVQNRIFLFLGWEDNSWIHAFPKVMSVMWNANSIVWDLNSVRRVHFLRRQPWYYKCLSIYIYIYIYLRVYVCVWYWKKTIVANPQKSLSRTWAQLLKRNFRPWFNILYKLISHQCKVTCLYLVVFVYTLPRLWKSDVNRSNKRKLFYIKKRWKQTISCRNYDRCRFRWWSNASHKYITASRISNAFPRTSSSRSIDLYVNGNKKFIC